MKIIDNEAKKNQNIFFSVNNPKYQLFLSLP
jgi:hypothetical protein